MARYTKDENGNLILTAGGTRTWIVTQAAHDRAVSAGTAPNNCLVAITDDYPTEEDSTGTGTFNATNIDTSKSNFCNWRKVGKVVQVSLQLYLLRKMTWNDADRMLISGLPAPFSGGETFICFNLTTTGICDMQLVTAGQLLAFDAVIGADAGSRIVSNFTYIAKE